MSEGATVWRAQGCGSCNHTGYVGRVGVYETLKIDDKVRRLIAAEADEEALINAAFPQGGTLSDRARGLVLAGVTSVEEAVRVTRQETPEAHPLPEAAA